MGESTEELTHDIEQTRGRLSTHLDELEDKVSPSAIVDRKKTAAQQRIGGVRDKVMGTARSAGDSVGSAGSGLTDSVGGKASDAADTAKEQFQGAPLAAGVAAFGLGMVIAALVPASKAETRAATQVKDVVQEAAAPVVEDAKSAAAGIGQELQDSALEAGQQVKDAGTDAVAAVKDEGQSSVESVRSDAGGA